MKYSIVSPVFNESACLEAFVFRLLKVLTPMHVVFEIILVDDGSKDDSFEVISRLADQYPQIRGFRLSRNFGHQKALDAGLKEAKGDAVIMLDSDLQHPPELIEQMITLFQRGNDVICCRRILNQSSGMMKALFSGIFYRVFNFLSETHIQPGCADFRLISRRALDLLLSMPEKNRFTRGLVAWLGLPTVYLDYHAAPRFAGKAGYSFFKSFSLALISVTSFSARPLHLSFMAGISTLGMLSLYVLYCVIDYFIHGVVRGWSSLFLTMVFLGAIQLISIGIVGEYLAKIYEELKSRPAYIISERTTEQKIQLQEANI